MFRVPIKTRLLRLSFVGAIILTVAIAADWTIPLKGKWRFEIGDNPNWAKYNLNDEHWEEIKVPANWEDQGFPGYDGFAWYRLHFRIGKEVTHQSLKLEIGAIDDVDEVYLNGELLGSSGGFHPHYETHYNQFRNYYIPSESLYREKMNILAVRVYDEGGLGGIVGGPVRLVPANPAFKPIVDLSGKWKFMPGDNSNYADVEFNDQDWNNILAPLAWENQGYTDLGDFAWYRKEFVLPQQPDDRYVIVLLGSIDDMDETYLNGKLIGSTGEMFDDPSKIVINQSDYAEIRAYYVPVEHFNWGETNLLAVRVYDGPEWGGITNGPIGIISRDNYQYWEKKSNQHYHIEVKSFEELMRVLFGN